MLGWHLCQGSGGTSTLAGFATSAWGQASWRAEKTCLQRSPGPYLWPWEARMSCFPLEALGKKKTGSCTVLHLNQRPSPTPPSSG